MNPFHNPFQPGAGNQPPELVGRDGVLRQAELTLARVKAGRAERGMLLVGLRGVGKTVLLNRIAELAESNGYQVAQIEVPEGKRLPELFVPVLRKILLRLSIGERLHSKTREALGALRSFIGAFKLSVGEAEITLQATPGTADSGDLEADLTDLLVSVGEAAKERQTAVVLVIDELQYLAKAELSALIMAMHRISQKALPVVLMGAGLPQLVGNAGQAKSYAERLFSYPRIDRLDDSDAQKALKEPVEEEKARIHPDALQEIVRQTQGYPYFLQEWGYQAWNAATGDEILLADVELATQNAILNLDQSFFRVRYDRLTPREKLYARAMAELGEGPQRSGDIADLMHAKVSTLAPLRGKLIEKGMVYSPAHGDTAFTVPLFDQFMKRVMPDMPSQA